MSGQMLELEERGVFSHGELEGGLSDVPYQNYVSQEVHRVRKAIIEEFLLKEGIVSLEEFPHVRGRHLTLYQWEMIKDSPEDYWPIVFSNGLVDDEYQKKLEPYFDASDRKLFHIFTFNQCVWFAVHRDVAHEIFDELVARRYRAFATLKKMVFPDELIPYPWGQEVINKCRTKTNTYSINPLHSDFIH